MDNTRKPPPSGSALTYVVDVEKPAVVSGVPVSGPTKIVPPCECVNTILPALFTLALTNGMLAKLTAEIKLATVPVPAMVTVAVFTVAVPASVACRKNVLPGVNARPVGVVVPVTIVAPSAALSNRRKALLAFGEVVDAKLLYWV